MIIELNLAQAEAILSSLSNFKEEPVALTEAKSAIKKIIKQETEMQILEIDRLIKRISDNGYKNNELTGTLSSTKEQISSESAKTKSKYFDDNGNEK